MKYQLIKDSVRWMSERDLVEAIKTTLDYMESDIYRDELHRRANLKLDLFSNQPTP